jgi:hypothetical protein
LKTVAAQKWAATPLFLTLNTNMSDRIFGFVCLSLAAFMVWGASIIEESFIQDPLGPKAFPILIALVLAWHAQVA